MPQSLVYELIDQLHAGTPLLTSLKRATFQAKWNLGEQEPEEQDVEKLFRIWKVNMRGLADNDPVYVSFAHSFDFPLLFSEHVLLFDASRFQFDLRFTIATLNSYAFLHSIPALLTSLLHLLTSPLQ